MLLQKHTIEQSLDFDLEWQELPESHACRIVTWKQNCPLFEEHQWPHYLAWYVPTIIKMHQTFEPIIKAINIDMLTDD